MTDNDKAGEAELYALLDANAIARCAENCRAGM
jgi:hypothetical protein